MFVYVSVFLRAYMHVYYYLYLRHANEPISKMLHQALSDSCERNWKLDQ